MSPKKEHLLSRNEIASCLLNALRAAGKAGDAIMEIYDSAFAVEYKDDRSPLTLADKNSHNIITACLNGEQGVESLTAGCKEMPVLSEEGREIPFEERVRWEHFWLVDPLDGTKEFIKRNGEFTVNIALMCKWTPVVGVIYIPVKRIFYFAALGLGARKMDAGSFGDAGLGSGGTDGTLDMVLRDSVTLPLEGREGKDTPGARRPGLIVAGSRSHSTSEFQDFLEEMKRRYGEVEFISAGSSLKFCLVAEGKADIYPRFGPTMEWDSAAGQCIVEQAGGRVVAMDDGLPLGYNKRDLRNPFFVCEGKGVRVFSRAGREKG